MPHGPRHPACVLYPPLAQELWARDHAWQLRLNAKHETRAKRKDAKKEAKAE